MVVLSYFKNLTLLGEVTVLYASRPYYATHNLLLYKFKHGKQKCQIKDTNIHTICYRY